MGESNDSSDSKGVLVHHSLGGFGNTGAEYVESAFVQSV